MLKVCGTQFYAATASYTLHWCVAVGNAPAGTGYLFGGLYTSSVANPLTKTRGCPKKFYPLRMGSAMSVCVSDDYELGYGSSLTFAGFYSCSVGNPLALKKKSASPAANKMLTLSTVRRQ